jgi:signal transduction histidine kinase
MNTTRALAMSGAALLLLAAVPARAADVAGSAKMGAPAPGEVGSAAEAQAMLRRAVAAVKADEAKALAAFSAGANGFRDRDLYVFCARRDGRVDAHIDPAQLGRNIKDQYDIDGVAFGQEMLAVAGEGSLTAVSYMWVRPGSHTPAPKVSFVTRVADQMCGVGYYK